jgi:DNA mismatch endonuclease (patch repair protein)
MAAIDERNRSRVMASIRGKDTRPELALRHALRQRGIAGYRCHVRELPGCPDLVFTKWRLIVFVDGAFWHGHPAFVRPGASTYWKEKIARNIARDRAAGAALASRGWIELRFWDLDVMADPEACARMVARALEDRRRAEGTTNADPGRITGRAPPR